MKIEDYIKAKSKIITRLSTHNPVSIYEYGTYKFPGLSDIDLIVVLKNKLYPGIKKTINLIKKQQDLKKFISKSTIMIMTERNFSNLLMFDNLKLKNLYGKKLKIINHYKLYKKELDLLSIIDWLPERTYRCWMINSGKILKDNYQIKANFLNTLKYTYQNLKAIKKQNIRCKSLINDIDQIRSNFFKDSRIKIKINKTLKACFDENIDILNEIAKDKKIKQIVRTNNYNAKLSILGKTGIQYLDDNFKQKKNDKQYLKLPTLFALCLEFYSSKKNIFSYKFKKFFIKKKEIKLNIKQKKIIKILKIRFNLINENYKLLKKNSLTSGLYKFGWML